MDFASRATAYDPDADQDLHHGLFLDLLHALTTRRGGTYRALAIRSGYDERYLRFIQRKQRAVPPPETLERLIGALPDVTEREARRLREFARRASPRRSTPPVSARLALNPAEVAADLARLLDANHAATHPDAASVGTGFLDVQAAATRTLAGIRDLDADPATSAHLSILLCNVLNVVDDAGGALKAARIAQEVLTEHAARTGTPLRPRLAALQVESLRTEAMTLHNLGLDRWALGRYERAEAALAACSTDPQRTYIALDRISALVGMRRFRLGDVKALVDDVHRACDRGLFSELETGLLVLQAGRGLVSAHVRHEDLKPRTKRLLDDELDRIERTEFAGPIHRVQLYRTAAEFSAEQGDLSGRTHFLDLGLQAARSAGLVHQARRIGEMLAS